MQIDIENETTEGENKELGGGEATEASSGAEFSTNESTETKIVPDAETATEAAPADEGETDAPAEEAVAAEGSVSAEEAASPDESSPSEETVAAASEDSDGDEPAEGVEEEVTGPQLRHPDNPEMRWYVVHTYSGYEEKAKNALFERVKNGKTHIAKFGEVIVPTTVSETTTKTGKKRQVTRTQFPGYMLVQMELDDSTLLLVKDTPRITGFVGNQRNPRALPDHEVMRYINPESSADVESSKPTQEVLFEKGEDVKVIDGPFSNFDGVVDEVKPDKARLRVLVSIFGRETPVELAYNQVEKLN